MKSYGKDTKDYPNQSETDMKAELAALGVSKEKIVKLEKDNNLNENWRAAYIKALTDANSFTNRTLQAARNLLGGKPK